MPLGFAKSILNTQAAAAGAATFYSFDTTGASGSGNTASYNFSGVDFTTNHQISIAMWFRANGTGWQNSGQSAHTMIGLAHNSTYPDWMQFRFQSADFGWHLQMLETDNAYITGRGYGNPAAQETLSFDGSWQLIMACMDCSTSNTDLTKRAMRLGDTDLSQSGDGQSNESWTASNYDFGSLRYARDGAGSGGIDNNFEVASGFQMGPMWVYNSIVDFDDATTRGYFYNSANTDGWVDPGTDGTGGGQAQPELFLYHNGTTLVNGGTDSITISETTQGTGAISVISNTVGPGTGTTI